MTLRRSIFRRLLSGVAVAVAAGIATAATAQVSASQRVALHNQGFSDAEIRAADALQIAPHFAFYQRWKGCWDQVALQSLSGGDRVSEVRHTAENLCSDEAGYLRASLAREFGLARANRIISLAEASLSISYDGIYARQHPAPPAGSTNVAGWTVAHPRPFRCAAIKIHNSLDSSAVVMSLDHDVPEMDFALDGSQARGLLFAAKGPDVSFKVTIADKGPAGLNIGNITLHMIANSNGAVLSIAPDQKFRAMIGGARDILLQDPRNTPYDFDIEGNEAAWAAVQQCARAQQ
jgi:hypothetical protein